MDKKVELFLVSFRRDREWCEFALKSVRKYATGFSGVTLVVPVEDYDLFKGLAWYRTKDDHPVRVVTQLEFPGKGMLSHEVAVCYADVFCPDADFIAHIDSDTLFTEPVSPEDYFSDGKPVLLVRTFESLVQFGPNGPINWQVPVENALGIKAPYETMARTPAVHYRWLYPEVRGRVEHVNHLPFYDFTLRQRNEWPQGFAEFPTLGMWVMHVHADKYCLIDTATIGDWPNNKIYQGWTHWKNTPEDQPGRDEMRAKFERIVA